ncbi:hypothetical protein U9M48_030012 [Paspalum notatum var. saurae]|uniref:NB-ARC domain-containing protein n=1 Tax=Paspalum notatum var. saurae TaxID=547442 RepID=A0AAQ3TZK5_PASNO
MAFWEDWVCFYYGRRSLKNKIKRHLRRLSNKDIEFVTMELRSIRAALRMVGGVPPEHLPQHLKVWADLSREVSYDIEDILDTFLVRVVEAAADRSNSKDLIVRKMPKARNPFLRSKKGRARREIANAISEVKTLVRHIAKGRARYADETAIRAQDIAEMRGSYRWIHPTAASVGTRLVGIDAPRYHLISLLTATHDMSHRGLKTVSIVGVGGLGKTTLARAVYQEIVPRFMCGAFVSLSMNPNMNTILANMLRQLDAEKYTDITEESWNEGQLLDELRQFLQNKRYLIAIDDIWDIKSWQRIRNALVDNNLGSRIITTTRKLDVADKASIVYELEPLSYENSKALLYETIFGSEGKNHDNQWDESWNKILKRCGGLPLPLLKIGRTLASKPREEWYDVFNNIESAFEGDSSGVDKIRRILLQSYYHLPIHLRACFLYVSVFPEDYEFRRDRLVWRWIAEGFIREKQGRSSFQNGQIYFEELLNRGMIREVNKNVSDGMAKYCQVHDLILDLACSLASDENFVTNMVDDQREQTFFGRKVRRLSLQNSRPPLQNVQLERRACTMQLTHVRSVSAFGTGINLMPPLSNFHVLRVLDLEGCDLRESYYDLGHLGGLLHLRYLGLRGTHVAQLPKDIGNLRFLQILDLKGTTIRVLPSTVALLCQLLCLYIEDETRMPNGLENLTLLEELSKISVSECPGFMKELASLVELKVLNIVLQQDMSENSQKIFLQSLCNLHKIQDFSVSGCPDLDFIGEGWEPPPSLQRFITVDGSFSVMPGWASNTENLSELYLGVRDLRREDLQSLGRLRNLRILRLAVERMSMRLAVDADAFPCLTQLQLRAKTCLVFCLGAMPKVAVLEFTLDMDRANGDFDWGLENLLSLEKVTVYLRSMNGASTAEGEAALKDAISVHPRHPTLEIAMVACHPDDDQQVQSVDGC